MTETASDNEHGWAGLAAAGRALLVPLTPAVLRAGADLAETARERARVADAEPADLLAGNAFLALEAGAGDARGMAAACLGAIARVRRLDSFVVRVTRAGEALDCAIESVAPGGSGAHAVRARLASLTGLAPAELVPGRVAEMG
ncbi:hypothetical protein SAMN05216241_10378 [Limimonas halophila]|uniref:Uncharacterized protein n=1 Tax=Limimonas halophila TaxID=1082479 RepID=A0A1G7PUG8_9PROT|nr:hypothetical protein [Limimonas halophila]SDF89967.1 hypothetical protein SAMN05216241_10378 [Limimonas halophila]